jgi:hypothetical protein
VELNKWGCPAVAAANDKRLGLDLHWELIRAGRFKIFQGACPYTIDELSTYHYPEPKDLGPDAKARDELPVEKDDHAMDAMRYCTISTVVGGKLRKPKVVSNSILPEKQIDHWEKRNRLLRNKENQTEKW